MKNNEKYVCVVGGANVDICGTPFSPLNMRDSNPGKVTLSLGGVGRNIAENLARLGVCVKFITVLGEDVHAEEIRSSCNRLGIDVSHSLTMVGRQTSTYLCLNDADGEMSVALSDMDIFDNLTPQYLAEQAEVIDGAECVVADTNVPQCLKYLLRTAKPPVFLDTVSAKKTAIVKDDVSGAFCLKPNLLEAEILTGVKVKDDETLAEAIGKMHASGAKWVIVSCGERGAYVSDGVKTEFLPTFAKHVVSTTGAGDSFVAGLVYGFVHGKDVFESATIGGAASALTVSDKLTVSPSMTEKAIFEIIKENIRK